MRISAIQGNSSIYARKNNRVQSNPIKHTNDAPVQTNQELAFKGANDKLIRAGILTVLGGCLGGLLIGGPVGAVIGAAAGIKGAACVEEEEEAKKREEEEKKNR